MTTVNALNILLTANQLIYATGPDNLDGLPTGINSILATNGTGVPSITNMLPLLVQSNITQLGTISAISTPLGAAFGGTGFNNAGTLSLAGNLSLSGAFSSTFTITAPTAVTFPTTGTLATTAGTISSILGTAAQIDVNTVASVATISINAGYLGQTSITTLGTITTGTWSGTAIAVIKGGTGLTSTTINQILYSSANNVIAGLATTNSGTLATSSTGVPSMVALGATQTLVGVSGATPAAGNIPGKNMIINGSFQVWQRGAGGTASFAMPATTRQYTADRWQCNTSANGASVVSQQAGATSGSYLLKFQRNNGQTGTGNMTLITSLTRDMCVGAAGSILTLSFKARAGANFSAAGGILQVLLLSGTGSTDVSALTGFTGSAVAFSFNAPLTTTLTNFSGTTGVIGATVTQLAFEFAVTPVGTAGVDDSFSITDVQLEISSTQTPFERLPFQTEYKNCGYFYQKSFSYDTAPLAGIGANTGEVIFNAVTAAATTNRSPTIRQEQTMLKTSVPVLFSPVLGATAQPYDETAAATATATAIVNTDPHGFTISYTGAAGTVVGNAMGLHWTRDAELV